MGRVRGGGGEGLGLERVQAPSAHGPAQAVTFDAMALAAQDDLAPARAVAAFVDAKDLDQRRFLSRLALRYALLLRVLPRVIPAGRYAQHLAEPAHGVRGPLPVDEAVTVHGLSVAESLRF